MIAKPTSAHTLRLPSRRLFPTSLNSSQLLVEFAGRILQTAKMANPLSMSREQYRKHAPTSTGQDFDKIVVGAAIPQPDDRIQPRILLLKRSATEEFYPNNFEIPCRKVDSTDLTIEDELKRKLRKKLALILWALVCIFQNSTILQKEGFRGKVEEER